jgi:hypothetical protein
MIKFSEQFVALDYEELKYNPCDDLIFPCVIRVDDKLVDPLGKYYLYYAPHNKPGGICLAYADDLRGPWKEAGGNPLIERKWDSHYDVSHISSPHALWRDDLKEIWLYYHGENTTTRWAWSKDGVQFSYGGEAIQTPEMADMSGASYARVFDSPFTESPGRFLMVVLLFKYEHESWERFDKFGLYGAWSDDGEVWSLCDEPIVSLADCGAESFVCSPFIQKLGEKVYLAYHLDTVTPEPRSVKAPAPDEISTDICAVEIDSGLQKVGEPFTVCERTLFGEENQRFADPCLIEEDGEVFLFGAIGPRLNQRIGVAVGDWVR